MTDHGHITFMAILTTYNRRETTVRCLESLVRCRLPERARLRVILADASSHDGTIEAARSVLPDAITLTVASDRYWAQGMRAAWERASREKYDYLVWLNDDVVLDEDAILVLYQVCKERGGNVVVAASMRDPDTAAVTYSGFRLGDGVNRLNMPRVNAASKSQPCNAFNGNLVLTPRYLDDRIGGFPKGYVHGIADYAYGLEATRSGAGVFLAPGTLGTCARNSEVGGWRDRTQSARDRFEQLRSPKGLPFGPWCRFCWRYGGLIGLISAVKPFVVLGVSATMERICSVIGLSQRRKSGKQDINGAGDL